MRYETIAEWSQVTSLLLFISIFIAVVVYAYWPSNLKRLEAAQRRALGLEPDHSDTGKNT